VTVTLTRLDSDDEVGLIELICGGPLGGVDGSAA